VIQEMGILASQTAHKTTTRVRLQNVSANFTTLNIITKKFIVKKSCNNALCFKDQSYKYYHILFIKMGWSRNAPYAEVATTKAIIMTVYADMFKTRSSKVSNENKRLKSMMRDQMVVHEVIITMNADISCGYNLITSPITKNPNWTLLKNGTLNTKIKNIIYSGKLDLLWHDWKEKTT